jgi:hypothetical protein
VTIIIITAEIIFSGIVKSNLKKGREKAKLKIRTLNKAEIVPYMYPSVKNAMRNTARTKTAGIRVSVRKTF